MSGTSTALSLRERLSRTLAMAKSGREKAKQGLIEIVGTVMGGATAAALGALDEAKGTAKQGDSSGIRTYNVGPVPVALIVGGLGKVGALALMGDGIAPIAGDIGQAGIDVAAYVTGRRAWAAHAAKAKK